MFLRLVCLMAGAASSREWPEGLPDGETAIVTQAQDSPFSYHTAPTTPSWPCFHLLLPQA